MAKQFVKGSKVFAWPLRISSTLQFLIFYFNNLTLLRMNILCVADTIILHVMHNIMLLLSTGRSKCQLYSHKLNQCSCIEQWAQCLTYLNCHAAILCLWWISLLLVDLCLVTICLFVCIGCCWLLLLSPLIRTYLVSEV